MNRVHNQLVILLILLKVPFTVEFLICEIISVKENLLEDLHHGSYTEWTVHFHHHFVCFSCLFYLHREKKLKCMDLV